MYVQLKQDYQKSHSKPTFVSNWRGRALMMILISFTCILPTHAQDKPVKTSPKKAIPSAKKTLPPKKTTPKKTEPAIGTNYDKTAYDIYVRAGLIAYLKQDYPKATEHFKKAKPYQPPRNFTVVHGTIPTGIDRLIAVAKQGKSLTPKSVLEGDEKARLILMLADVYHTGGQSGRAIELCNRVLKGRTAKKATKAQRSYAYFRRGRSRYHVSADTMATATEEELNEMDRKTYQDYMSSQKIAPKELWAVDAMYKAAVMLWNHGDKSTPKKTIQVADRSIALHRRVVKTYPGSRQALNSFYLVGVLYQWSGRYKEAKRALEKVQLNYPDQMRDDVSRRLKDIAHEIDRQQRLRRN